mmetsp:Transcript_49084/g.116839  ORF Transcript_49084/g.116839 Transcript_49084/m.116839 type:complete len:683 (+) Transcript_49084:56-2104(+)
MEGAGAVAFGTPAPDPHVIAFDLPPPSLRIFHRALQCIGKLGREVALIFRAEELVLHGADDSKSYIMQFSLRRRFFRSLPGQAALSSAEDGKSTAMVAARSLLVAIRSAQHCTDGLVIGLCDGDGDVRLGLEFTTRQGLKIRHRVPLLDTEVWLPKDPAPGVHTAALTPSLVSRVLDHCTPPSSRASSCEEITIAAVPDGLRVSSVDLLRSGGAQGTGPGRTEVMIQKSDLEACVLDERGGEVVFSGRCLREFARVADSNLRDFEGLGIGAGAPLLEMRFGPGTSSVVCRLVAAPQGGNAVLSPVTDFSAVLLIATRDLQGESQPVQPEAPASTPAQPPSTPAAARKPQPRQGSKRRAVESAVESSFDAFPDHSQATAGKWAATQPAVTPARPAPAGSAAGVAQPDPPLQAQPAAQKLPPPRSTTSMFQTSLGSFITASQGGSAPSSFSRPLAQQVKVQATINLTDAPPSSGPVPSTVPQTPAVRPPVVGSTPQGASGMQQPLPEAAPMRSGGNLLQVPTPCQQQPQRQAQEQPLRPVTAQQVTPQQQPPLKQQPLQQPFQQPVQQQQPLQQQPLHQQPLGQPPLVPQPFPQPPVLQNAQLPLQRSHESFAAHLSRSLPPQAAAPPAGQLPPVMASQLMQDALDVLDSDNELIGADPDEVAFAPALPGDEENVDWLDVEKLW